LTIEKVSEKQLIVFLDETNPSQTWNDSLNKSQSKKWHQL
jgi:hypothetical protein